MSPRPRLSPYHGDIIELRTGEPLRAASKREADYGARMLEDNGPPGTFLLDDGQGGPAIPVFVRLKPTSEPTAPPVAAASPARAGRPARVPDDFTTTVELAAGEEGNGGKRRLVRVTVRAHDPDDDDNLRAVLLEIKHGKRWTPEPTELRIHGLQARLDRDGDHLDAEGYDMMDRALSEAFAEAAGAGGRRKK